MLAAVVGVMTMVMVDMTVLLQRTQKQNKVINSMLVLESEFLGSISNIRTYADPLLKARMSDGVTLPPIPLVDSNGNPLIELPATPRRRVDIRPAVAHFDRDLKPCSSFNVVNCIFRLEASLIMKSGTMDPRAREGRPEWITQGSPAELASRFPVYAVAYRITVDSKIQSLRTRGVDHLNAMTDLDHLWPVPHEIYMPIKELKTCSGNGVLVGTHPDTREPICAEPANMCSDPTNLAKQVVVNGQDIGVECVPWKSVSCPPDYVVSQFRPRLLDSDTTATGNPGSCVFIGADRETQTSRSMNTGSTELNCADKYKMTGTCTLVDERVISQCSWRDAGGVMRYQNPNRGSAVMSRTASGLVCTRRDPARFCTPPYSGGQWTSEVELDATCTIKPGERFKPLDAS